MDNITFTEETVVPEQEQQAVVEHQFDVETQAPVEEETQAPTPEESPLAQEESPLAQEESPLAQEEPPLAQQLTSGDLIGIEVANENVALNLLVSFVNLAHSRNAFNLQESAKIWECIQKFIQPRPTN
jgi:hypothetical protein